MEAKILTLPETQATIVDPHEKTIKHVPVEDISPKFIDSLNLEKCYYEEKRTFFYSSADTNLDSWTFEDRDVKQTFHGTTYILGLRADDAESDGEHFFPPRIHQRFISNYIFFQ